MKDDVRNALERMVRESNTHALVAAQLRRTFGWSCNDRDAGGRLTRMLSAREAYNLHPDAITIIIEISGLDYVSPLLHRAHARAQMEREREQDTG